MAEYQIKSKDGLTTRATGAPVYNGTYLKPGYLEFREIGSPTPIAWQVGDYVDYTRTGLRYKLYNTPKVRKQGEQNLYGGSFVYENVQFFDITKELELAPFIDVVPADNDIHFSTLNSVAFIGTPANVAERIEACLGYWFPSSNWEVNVISGLDPSTDADLIQTLATEAEFSVSGASCQDVLDKIYDIWNGLGFSYALSNGSNIITIGAPNKRTVSNTTASYGRIGDNGIVTLARSISNAEEMGTRLYTYGSMKNMPTGYYREKDIKDAESVDIEHLMLPIGAIASLDYDGWGLTNGVPDASKAYIENDSAVSQHGLIPRYVYFDGSDSNYPDIYPSIEGVTIGDVIDAKESVGDDTYVPSLSKWSRSDRIDEIVSAVNPSDSGGPSSSGSKYNESGTHTTDSGTIDFSDGEPFEHRMGNYSPSLPADAVDVILNVDGTVNASVLEVEELDVFVRVLASSTTRTTGYEIPVLLQSTSTTGVYSFTLEDATAKLSLSDMTQVELFFVVQRSGYATAEFTATINLGTVFLGYTSSLGKTFGVKIPQIGFDIIQYADMGNGKTISMKSGMCAGRDFPINSATYESSTDTWKLTLSRVKDSDTGLYFPNSDFPIASGDKYVLLDIAMPELYITMASVRLLKAAQRLLSDIDHEKPFYEPEIDSKKVVEESRVLREGMWMHLVGDEIVDDGEDYSIIDTLQIDEDASNIPVYSVTLREKKPVEWTESISPSSLSKSSSSVDEPVVASPSGGGVAPDWFVVETYTEDSATKYRLKLNPKYQGMYADGWVSAGGISSGGGGGGGGASSLWQLDDVYVSPEQLVSGQVLTWDASAGTNGKWVAGNGGGGGNYLPLAGGTMTGQIKMTSDSNVWGTGSVWFTHLNAGTNQNDAYVGANTSGSLSLRSRGAIYLRPSLANDSTLGIVMTSSSLSYNGISLLDTWGTTSGNTVELTVGGTKKTLLLSSYSPDLSNYVTTSALTTTLESYAPKNSPTLTGTPTAPTATAGTNNTQIATTAFVKNAIDTKVGDYLPLAGGNMTGPIGMRITSTSLTTDEAFRFYKVDGSSETILGSIRAASGGALGIYANSDIRLRPGGSTTSGVVITTGDITFNGRSMLYRQLYSSESNTSGSGIFIKTVVPANANYYIYIHIMGVYREASQSTPIDTYVTFHSNNSNGAIQKAAAVHNGYNLGTISVFVYDEEGTSPTGTNGRIGLWFERPSQYSTISVYGRAVLSVNMSTNIVSSVTYAAKPSGSHIARNTSITRVGHDSLVPLDNNTQNLGSTGNYWKYAYVKRVYLSSTVYLEADSNGYLFTNSGFYANGFISAGGLSTT